MSQIEKTLKSTLTRVTDAGTVWYPMKGIAGLLGETNPRQMMDKLKGNAQERQFCVKNAAGRFVEMIHISEANVKALMDKKGMSNDAVVLEALKTAPEAEKRGAETQPPVEVATNSEDITPEPKIQARKKRKSISAYMISKKEYAALMGMSIGTVYKHVKDGKLKEMKGYKEDLMVMEHDESYDRLNELLKDPETDIKEYWKISIIRSQ